MGNGIADGKAPDREGVNRLFTIMGGTFQPHSALGGLRGMARRISGMAQLLKRYVQYRRIGFQRLAALRFAWMVATAGNRPAVIHRLARQ
jgi:hypothetical protein